MTQKLCADDNVYFLRYCVVSFELTACSWQLWTQSQVKTVLGKKECLSPFNS